MELYRNNSGTDYPYITEGIVPLHDQQPQLTLMHTIIKAIGKLH